MHDLKFKNSNPINWTNASTDYLIFRPGPPLSFFQTLHKRGIGVKGQKLLDLGTGTGALPIQFAHSGVAVVGVDASEGQILAARKQAKNKNLSIEFQVSLAESLPFAASTFDVITANQCWVYFDLEKTLPEVKRVLKTNGILVTSHFSYLACIDPIASASEKLIAKYNPHWEWGNWDGHVPHVPNWSKGRCTVKDWFVYDELIPFTRETWRGRMRAHRAIGAELSSESITQFDAELQSLLEKNFPPSFSVLHRIDAHLFIFGES